MAGHSSASSALASPRQRRRIFTPRQADKALVLVRKIVADITRDYARLGDLQESLDLAQQTGMYDQAERGRDRIVHAVQRIQACAKELDDLGVDLEDWTLGVVDFPCMAGGREVSLCWRPEDPAVGYWHEVDQDCAGRRPLSTLPVSYVPAWQDA